MKEKMIVTFFDFDGNGGSYLRRQGAVSSQKGCHLTTLHGPWNLEMHISPTLDLECRHVNLWVWKDPEH